MRKILRNFEKKIGERLRKFLGNFKFNLGKVWKKSVEFQNKTWWNFAKNLNNNHKNLKKIFVNS